MTGSWGGGEQLPEHQRRARPEADVPDVVRQSPAPVAGTIDPTVAPFSDVEVENKVFPSIPKIFQSVFRTNKVASAVATGNQIAANSGQHESVLAKSAAFETKLSAEHKAVGPKVMALVAALRAAHPDKVSSGSDSTQIYCWWAVAIISACMK